MMRWVPIVPILLLASAAWPQDATPKRPDAASLLKEVAETYAHLQDANLHIEAIEESTTSNDLERDWRKTYRTLIRESGNRFRLETRSPFGLWMQISDGKTEWIYWVDAKSYVQHPFKGMRPTRYRGLFGGDEQLVSAWDTTTFLESLAAKNRNAKLVKSEKIKLNGHKFSCYVVQAQGKENQPGVSSDRTFWIDKQAHIFRKIVEHDRTFLLAGNDVRTPLIEDGTTIYPVFDIDPVVPESTFQFTPPAEVKLVDDLRPEWARKLPPGLEASTKVYPEPKLQLTDSTGKIVSLESYRGKPLLIDLWATWCEPCIASMPDFKKITNEYHDSGLVAVSIDEDKDAKTALDYLKQHGYTWVNYHDSNDEALHAFHGEGIPLVVLINKDGSVIFEENDDGYEAPLSAELTKIFPKLQSEAAASAKK